MPVRSLFFRSFLSSFTFYYLSRPGARVLVVRRDLIIYYLFFFLVFLVLLLLRCSESRRRQLHHKWPHYGRIPAIVCPDSDEGGLVVGQSPGQPHLPCRVHPQRHHQLVPQWTQSRNWLQYPHARLQRREHHHRTSTCPAIRLVVHCYYHYQLLRRSDDDLIPNANTMICIITDNERRWTGDAIRPQLLRYLSLSGHEHSRKGRARHRLARSPTARPASPNQIRDHYRWVPSSRFMDLAFNLFCFKILSNHHKLCFLFLIPSLSAATTITFNFIGPVDNGGLPIEAFAVQYKLAGQVWDEKPLQRVWPVGGHNQYYDLHDSISHASTGLSLSNFFFFPFFASSFPSFSFDVALLPSFYSGFNFGGICQKRSWYLLLFLPSWQCQCLKEIWRVKRIKRGGGLVQLNFCAPFISRLCAISYRFPSAAALSVGWTAAAAACFPCVIDLQARLSLYSTLLCWAYSSSSRSRTL